MSYQPVPTGAEDAIISASQKGIYALGVRRDSDSAPVADGRLAGLSLDEEGRLKTSTKTANFATVSGSTNSVASTVVVDTRRASNVVFHLKNTSATTATGATAAFHFEASIDSTNGTDGTWFRIQAVRSNINTIDSGTSVIPGTITVNTGLTFSWEASVNAYQYMRIYCAVAPAAGSNAVWTIQRGAYATEPIPAAQVSAPQAVTLTSTTLSGVSNAVNATIVASSGTLGTLVTAATTNATSWKASAGSLYEITLSNVTATPAYVKLYSKASAPTVGTDVPLVTIAVPANTTLMHDFGTIGKRFSAGIAIAVTGAAPATDTTAFVAGMQVSATYL